MPTVIAILGTNGLEEATYTADSLSDAVQYEGAGIYTVTRTYKTTQTLMLDAHLDRMEESAQIEGIRLDMDRIRLRAALRELIVQSGYPESRFRITVPATTPNQVVLTVEPFTGVPEAVKRLGVQAVTVDIMRDNPTSKDNAWITQRQAAVENAPNAYEYLIVNDAGDILEGFTSNFYAIRQGEVYTAPDGTVLGGISRRIALKVAPSICPVNVTPANIAWLDSLEGAFLTSSSRGVIPIVKINEHQIGDGKPSQITQQILAAYDTWVDENLEEL